MGKTELRRDQLGLLPWIRGGGTGAEEGLRELGMCRNFKRAAPPQWRRRMRCPRFGRTSFGAQRPPEASGRRLLRCLCVGFVVPEGLRGAEAAHARVFPQVSQRDGS